MRRRALAALAIALALGAAGPRARAEGPIVVGSKRFTESRILAELMAQVIERLPGTRVERRWNLAGTQVCFAALRSGEIDLYPEYTGTGLRNILGRRQVAASPARVFRTVARIFRERYDLEWLAPFGFDNTYVLVARREVAVRLGLRRIGDLRGHPLRFGFSHEFLRRPDGLPGLVRAYGLGRLDVKGMEHDLAYQALREGRIDVTDGYATDAKLADSSLVPLEDDLRFFPPYEAAPLVRGSVVRSRPEVAAALRLLAGRIDAATMRRLNREVEENGRSEAAVATSFLASLGLAEAAPSTDAGGRQSFPALFWARRHETLRLGLRHLMLTGLGVGAACLVAVPLGIAVRNRPRLAALAVQGAGILQTIPSIALLAFMLPVFGVGVRPAVAALFLYGILPILRNTVTGLRGIDPRLIDAGRGLGMRPRQLLWLVELPLALPVILAGIRTSTVINVGTATLAAFIGAGGLGDPIVTGLSVTDTNLVLCGAVPAAALAVAADAALGMLERRLTVRVR